VHAGIISFCNTFTELLQSLAVGYNQDAVGLASLLRASSIAS